MVSSGSRQKACLNPVIPKLSSGELALKEFYSEHEDLGEGGQGSVILVERNSDNKLFALKKESKEKKINSKDEREIECFESLCHFTAHKVTETICDPSYRLFFTEWCDSGSLDFVRKESPSSVLKHIHPIAFQTLCFLQHIHNEKRVHCDIKPGNIFVKTVGLIAFGDFGLSSRILSPSSSVSPSVTSPKKRKIFGTPAYLSPEALEFAPPAPPRDMYAAGAVLYELITGILYSASDFFKDRKSKRVDETPLSLDDYNRRYPKCASKIKSSFENELLFRMVQQLTQIDPAKRPTSNDLLFSPYFQISGKMFIRYLKEYEAKNAISSEQRTRIESDLRAQCGDRLFQILCEQELEEHDRRKYPAKPPISPFPFKIPVKSIYLYGETTHENAAENADFPVPPSSTVGAFHRTSTCIKPFTLPVEPSLDEESGSKEKNKRKKKRNHCNGAISDHSSTYPYPVDQQTYEIERLEYYLKISSNKRKVRKNRQRRRHGASKHSTRRTKVSIITSSLCFFLSFLRHCPHDALTRLSDAKKEMTQGSGMAVVVPFFGFLHSLKRRSLIGWVSNTRPFIVAPYLLAFSPDSRIEMDKVAVTVLRASESGKFMNEKKKVKLRVRGTGGKNGNRMILSFPASFFRLAAALPSLPNAERWNFFRDLCASTVEKEGKRSVSAFNKSNENKKCRLDDNNGLLKKEENALVAGKALSPEVCCDSFLPRYSRKNARAVTEKDCCGCPKHFLDQRSRIQSAKRENDSEYQNSTVSSWTKYLDLRDVNISFYGEKSLKITGGEVSLLVNLESKTHLKYFCEDTRAPCEEPTIVPSGFVKNVNPSAHPFSPSCFPNDHLYRFSQSENTPFLGYLVSTPPVDGNAILTFSTGGVACNPTLAAYSSSYFLQQCNYGCWATTTGWITWIPCILVLLLVFFPESSAVSPANIGPVILSCEGGMVYLLPSL